VITTTASFSHIRKRDGRLAPFELSKITKAIRNAGRATGDFDSETAEVLSLRVLTLAQTALKTETPSVEEIQNLVEEALLASPFKRTAKAYILYRDQHARIREMVTASDLDMIDSYLQRSDWKVRENGNMTYSLQGLNNYIASQVSEVYWLNKIYTPEMRQAHLEGDFHIHDLGQLSVYCVGWDLQDLLLNGFKGVPGKVESAPARHFRSALGQVVNFFYTLQGEAAGAQAFSHFDTLLAPFIRYDKLKYSEVKQALQEFVFNVNVPTRVGFQTPFTNVTMDLQPSGSLAAEPVIYGGKRIDDVYGDFGPEAAMFNQAFLEVLEEGDAKERVFTFPIPTYNITPDFNWDAPGLDRLWDATAKYGIPYFANFVNADMTVEDARSMCCRLRLDTRKLEKRGGGLFGANPLTGSIGVVTVNLPRLGYLSDSETDFFERLTSLMEIARDSLETKRKVLERLAAEDLYPYTRYYLRDIFERRNEYWGNHFSTIGLIGMHEACLNLLDTGIDSDTGHDFAQRVLNFMRDLLTKFQEETGHMYNLEATPAEGTTYRLANLDKTRYPSIRTSGAEGESFYTNSSQLPVDYDADIFRSMDLQDDLQALYTGGTVQHVYLGEAAPDAESVKNFVRTVCQNYKLPYFTLTPSFSVCPNHGYLRGEKPVCDDCGSETEVYSRVVGYLRPVSQWNAGKQAEFALRTRQKIA
jgi:ribonucleoside-triphosphate reductase